MIALVRSPSAARAEQVAKEIEADPSVAGVLGYFNTRNRAFVARNGQSSYLAVSFHPIPSKQENAVAKRIEARFADQPDVTLGGALVAGRQVGRQVSEDLAFAEMLAFPILFALSLLIFRGVVAALLPLIGGSVAIVTAFLGLRIVNSFTPLSVYALNLVTGLGLGLAIDYSLFIVSRFREELAAGATTRRGGRPHARDGREDGAVQLAHGRRRTGLAARLPAAVPLLDGHRRDPRRAALGRQRPARPAGHPVRARAAHQRACAAALARLAGAHGHGGILVPPLPHRHAAARAHRHPQRRLHDLAGVAGARRPLHRHRRQRAAEERERAPGLGRAAEGLPAQSARRRSTSRRVARKRSSGAFERSLHALDGAAAVSAPQAVGYGRLAHRRRLGTPALAGGSKHLAREIPLVQRRRSRCRSAARPRNSSTCRRACGRTCRSRRRSSCSRRCSCCSS